MAFWIVYQGNSWDRSRKGGYLWAPKRGKNGQTQEYWSNMERVRPGDLIFSGVNNAIRAVSQTALPAYNAERPDPLDEEFWYGEGWRLDVVYTDLSTPLFYNDWVPAVQSELQAKHAAFHKGGGPNQGYLFALPDSVGEFVIRLARQTGEEISAAANRDAPPPIGGDTERQALAKARIGQGRFRQDLLSLWGGRCAISGVDRPELLRASHIKPWAASNNAERLDPANGILLSAAYDAAFDAMLISFGDDGALLLAADFPAAAAVAAGINPNAKLLLRELAARAYLRAHRDLMQARAARAITIPSGE